MIVTPDSLQTSRGASAGHVPRRSAAAGLALRLLLQTHRVGVNHVIVSVVGRQNAPHGLLKCRRHIGGVLGAGLKVGESAVLPAPLPRVLAGHLALRHVQLVAQDQEGEVVGVLDVGVEAELLLPVGQVAEALAVVQAEGEQAAVGAAVERRAEAAEALLPRRVPDLQGDAPPVHLQLLVEELHPDGVEEVRVKLVGDVAVHERGLAHAAVPQEDHLQERRLGHGEVPAQRGRTGPGRPASAEEGPHGVRATRSAGV